MSYTLPFTILTYMMFTLVVLLVFIHLAFPKIRSPRNTRRILVFLTIILTAMQIFGYAQIAAYSTGELTPFWNVSKNIQPGETYVSDTILNIQVSKDFQVFIETTGPLIEFYIMDLNNPSQKFYAYNSSRIEVGIQLPYLHYDIITPAEWVFVLENTLHRNPVSVSISMYRDWLDHDYPLAEMLVIFNTFSQTMLIVIWIFFVVGRIWNKRSEETLQESKMSNGH